MKFNFTPYWNKSQYLTHEFMQYANEHNMLERNFDRPPVKDTVGIMNKGYTIIRFVTDNPGIWLLHCHMDWHQEFGMMMMLRVGTEKDLLPKPKNWPTCGDYDP
jgi:L-ascorbate oxidase